MKELVEFLAAMLDADEARMAEWAKRGVLWPHEDHDRGECDECDKRRSHRDADSALYDRFTAEVEAKRRIIELYVAAVAADDAETDWEGGYATWARRKALESVVKIHAACYADHRDYVEEWKP